VLSRKLSPLLLFLILVSCQPSKTDLLLDQTLHALFEVNFHKRREADSQYQLLLRDHSFRISDVEIAALKSIHRIAQRFDIYADSVYRYYRDRTEDFERHKHSDDFPVEVMTRRYQTALDSLRSLVEVKRIPLLQVNNSGDSPLGRCVFLLLTEMKYEVVQHEIEVLSLYGKKSALRADNGGEKLVFTDLASRAQYTVGVHHTFLQQYAERELLIDSVVFERQAVDLRPRIDFTDVIGILTMDSLKKGKYVAKGSVLKDFTFQTSFEIK
jgi:hypothetical protein